MGFRLSVQPVLPINNKTLIYGSSDGGVKYESTHKTAKEIMERLGEQIHLKAHVCVDSKGKEHTIIGPGDIEIHQGMDDYVYAIDTARLMPPDLDIKAPNSIFYQQFRYFSFLSSF